MTTRLSLGDVQLSAHDYAGFDLPSFGTRTRVLSDGYSTGNETYQTGSTPRRQALLSGVLVDYDDVSTLRGYNASKETITFADTVTGESCSVVVDDFSASTSVPDLTWSYQMTLLEVPS